MNSGAYISNSDLEAWQRVGQAVASRRSAMGIGQIEAGHAAGVGSTLWSKLENARQTQYRRLSIGRVENFLGWEPGSIGHLLEHGIAPLRANVTYQDIDPSDLAALKKRQDEMASQIRELRDTLSDLLNAIRLVPKLR